MIAELWGCSRLRLIRNNTMNSLVHESWCSNPCISGNNLRPEVEVASFREHDLLLPGVFCLMVLLFSLPQHQDSLPCSPLGVGLLLGCVYPEYIVL